MGLFGNNKELQYVRSRSHGKPHQSPEKLLFADLGGALVEGRVHWRKLKAQSIVTFHWLGGSVGWSFVPMCQGCRFSPQSRHIQESSGCMSEWRNRLMFLSLPFSKKKKERKRMSKINKSCSRQREVWKQILYRPPSRVSRDEAECSCPWGACHLSGFTWQSRAH